MTARRAPLSLASVRQKLETVKICQQCRLQKYATASTSSHLPPEDLEPLSSFKTPGPPESAVKEFDPLARAQTRTTPLPRSRYRYKPPRYFRGPLHPRQPLKPSDPNSREFIPGPFSVPRLEQTYHSTLAPDLLSLLYQHYPPGKLPGPAGQRLRGWDGSSPYHKNRPLRGPRGGPALPLMDRPITFRNVPRLEKIHVHTRINDPAYNLDKVNVAGMVLQCITNVRATVHTAKESIDRFNLVKNKPCAVSVELRGETMYDFMAKLVDIVLPKIKEWEGVSAGSGDSNGNIQFGLVRDAVGLFPEIEINFDSYPTTTIPRRVDISICTTATNDADARLLLSSMGIPFYGPHVN